MKESFARAVFEADRSGEVRLRENYSGRFMYGKETFALTGNESDITDAAGDALEELICGAADVYDAGVLAREFVQEVFGGRRDSMGLGVVWY